MTKRGVGSSFHEGRGRFLRDLLMRRLMPELTQKLGPVQARIMLDWPLIVGAEMARDTIPKQLCYASDPQGDVATLHLLVRHTKALEYGYRQTLLCDKIALYFGYRAVKNIKMIQSVFASDRWMQPSNSPYDMHDKRYQSMQKNRVPSSGLDHKSDDPLYTTLSPWHDVICTISDNALCSALERLAQWIPRVQSLSEEK